MTVATAPKMGCMMLHLLSERCGSTSIPRGRSAAPTEMEEGVEPQEAKEE